MKRQHFPTVLLALATLAGISYAEMLELPAAELQRRIRTRFAS